LTSGTVSGVVLFLTKHLVANASNMKTLTGAF